MSNYIVIAHPLGETYVEDFETLDEALADYTFKFKAGSHPILAQVIRPTLKIKNIEGVEVEVYLDEVLSS